MFKPGDVKVGDKVRIVGERRSHWNPTGMMDKWFNQIVTIKDCSETSITFSIEEDPRWMWKVTKDIAEIIREEPPKPTEFKVGDRVVATQNWCKEIKGTHGTVVIVKEGYSCGVVFDGDFDGHNLNGTIEDDNGWWLPFDCLELENPFLKPLFDELHHAPITSLTTLIDPPELNRVQMLKCLIVKDSYPYASLDANGELNFYATAPTAIRYFELARVTASV